MGKLSVPVNPFWAACAPALSWEASEESGIGDSGKNVQFLVIIVDKWCS
jgi:hypothetical protein